MSEKNAKKNRIKRELPDESKDWKRPEKRRFMLGKNIKVEIIELKETEDPSTSSKTQI